MKKDNTVVKTLAQPMRASIPAENVTGSTVACLVDENGIVKGDGKNFLPNDNVTREQLATFLYRYASKYNVDTTGRANLTSFPDSGSASIYTRDALEWAFHTGLIKGGDDGRLDPTGSATRAQIAVILKRFIEYINQ